MIAVRDMRASDWEAVEAVYRQGIDDGEATFESRTPSWEDFDAGRLRHPRLVAERDGAVIGWAAASLVSRRQAYRGVIEHSVYVARSARATGSGRRCSPPSSRRRTTRATGPSSPASSRRTPRACASISRPASAWSVAANGSPRRWSARTPDSGATRSSSNDGEDQIPPTTRSPRPGPTRAERGRRRGRRSRRRPPRTRRPSRRRRDPPPTSGSGRCERAPRALRRRQ